MFHIEPLSNVPVYEQIVKQVKQFMLCGALKPQEQLPSVREVSAEHTINPRTVLKAYSALEAEKLITAVPGKGYFISPDASDEMKNACKSKLPQLSQLLNEMALAGIPREDVLSLVESAYREKSGTDNENDNNLNS